MVLLSVLLSLTCGFCVAFQSPTNTALSRCVGNFMAATISFGGGTLLLLMGVLAIGEGDLAEAFHVPAWQLAGGLYGAYMVLMITFAAPVLGIALTLTVSMLGQMSMGIVVDTFGWFGLEAAPLAPLRVAGCLAVAAGIILVYAGKQAQGSGAGSRGVPGERRRSLLMAGLTFLAGVGCAVQVPTNTALAVHTGRLEASLISFAGGFAALCIVTLLMSRGRLPAVRGRGIRPWMVTGGVYGATVVFFNIVATPYIGVALVMASSMLGQLANAIFIDTFGILQAPRIPMNRMRNIGVLVIALGVVLVTLARL